MEAKYEVWITENNVRTGEKCEHQHRSLNAAIKCARSLSQGFQGGFVRPVFMGAEITEKATGKVLKRFSSDFTASSSRFTLNIRTRAVEVPVE
jgi:hypothetical protein